MGDRCLEISQAGDQPRRIIFFRLSGNFSSSRDITFSGGSSSRPSCKTRSQLSF